MTESSKRIQLYVTNFYFIFRCKSNYFLIILQKRIVFTSDIKVKIDDIRVNSSELCAMWDYFKRFALFNSYLILDILF